MARRVKSLTAADLALWREVARSVTPLAGRPVPEAEPATSLPVSAAPEVSTAVALVLKPVAAKPAQPPLAPLERRLRTQLRRGQQGVDAAIDLHGLRQDEAHAALIGFLRREQARGCRLTLVVTGKGGREGAFGDERGVLRRLVPHWLRLPDLRPLVMGFEEAEQRHGGSGALYVRLRRPRESMS